MASKNMKFNLHFGDDQVFPHDVKFGGNVRRIDEFNGPGGCYMVIHKMSGTLSENGKSSYSPAEMWLMRVTRLKGHFVKSGGRPVFSGEVLLRENIGPGFFKLWQNRMIEVADAAANRRPLEFSWGEIVAE